MKHVALVIFAVLVGGSQSKAIVMIEDRPQLRSEMKVLNGTYGFRDLKTIDVTLLKNDKAQQPTSIDLTYSLPASSGPEAPQVIERHLRIYDIEADNCGTVTYYASLNEPQIDRELPQARFHAVLQDHSHRVCENLVLGIWELRIREGYGFCGTMDSTLFAAGSPESVKTIQNF